MWHVLLCVCVGLGAMAGRARAEDTPRPRLSDQGRVLIGGSVGGSWSNDKNPYLRSLGGEEWVVDVSPSVAYFLWPRIALGAYGSYARQQVRTKNLSLPYYGLGPQSYVPESSAEQASPYYSRQLDRAAVGAQVIAELVLGPRVGLFFWLTAGYSYELMRKQTTRNFYVGSNTPYGTGTTQRVPFEGMAGFPVRAFESTLFLPLTFHVSGSVAIGLGPRLQWRHYFKEGGANWVRVGVASWIGASF